MLHPDSSDSAPQSIQLNSLSLDFIESLYQEYLTDPARVSPAWREYFDRERRSAGGNGTVQVIGPRFQPRSIFNPGSVAGNGRVTAMTTGPRNIAALQERAAQLVRNYRVRGHIAAQLDPLRRPVPHVPELEPSFYGLTEEDMDIPLSTELVGGADVQTLRQIIERMRNTYCRHIGVQFMHIDDLRIREWLQQRMEYTQNTLTLSREEQRRVFKRLTDAVVFEQFIQTKYVGTKSFSLEGAETLIPLLDLAIEKTADQGVDEIVIGMAHRGRLNVLTSILGKRPRDIFREFEDIDPRHHIGGGDVKYHLGYSSDWISQSGRKIHLSLSFNPSHLEYINPVALGRMRAKQDRVGDHAREKGMVMLIHGDAAFAGEGIVQETLNLSELNAYKVGGTLHIVVNNQIGFTTGPEEGRSTVYATDVARMLQIPIFHVNGEYPEAVAQVVRLALDFRATFKKDVVVDMYCYRQLGHSEGDEPAFTQPLMYKAIRSRKSVRDSYLDHLLKLGGLTREEADEMTRQRQEELEAELAAARSNDYVRPNQTGAGIWKGYHGGPIVDEKPTGVDRKKLAKLLEATTHVPEGFHVHRKVERGLEARREMARGERPLDWAAGEALAFATLATQGIRVRMTGQDVARGTFSQRHAVLVDQETGQRYMPLAKLAPDQAPIELYNSPLSEAGVLGFEYGYSLDCPDGLILWEAQFGDFVNVAQVIIDQFITSARDKWKRYSGLVMLLPHGMEGHGPEHSSARLERFLTLAADENIQIANVTTPAQFFHLLRRQVLNSWRVPLVVMTPKSLLRHPLAVSTLDELATGGFQKVIADPDHTGPRIKRVLLCTGKIYYELLEARKQQNREDVAIVRLEQLYPFPHEDLRRALESYPDGTPVVFVQEEPHNMGAWRYIKAICKHNLYDRLPLSGVTRPESASPATGSSAAHKLEQQTLIDKALGGSCEEEEAHVAETC
mgnify:CR=1 FL=1